MTIPYLTTWTVADLAFLRTAIETCEQRCPTCAHYPPGTSHSICSGPCKGTGKLYDYTLCDWLAERMYERFFYHPSDNPGTDGWPRWGVDSWMTEACLLFGQPMEETESFNEASWGMGGDKRYARKRRELEIQGFGDFKTQETCVSSVYKWTARRTMPPLPLPLLVRFGEMVQRPAETLCETCICGQIIDYSGAGRVCPDCHGTGRVSPDAERPKRIAGWRVEPSQLPSPELPWWVGEEGFRTKAEANAELRRRVLEQFSDCGRSVECDVCEGHGDRGEMNPYPCRNCQGSGKRIVKPVEFLTPLHPIYSIPPDTLHALEDHYDAGT